MTEHPEGRDDQWEMLLTRCYGKVEADAAFRSRLLGQLKAKASETKDERSDAGLDSDVLWSKLLAAAYPPCEARAGFKANLIAELKDKIRPQTDAAVESQVDPEEAPIRTLITKVYVPVEPRREFQTRLLLNLKDRQKTAVRTKEYYRRRSIFSSFASGLAAAAAVLFVVWLAPIGDRRVGESPEPEFGMAYADIEDSVLPDTPPAPKRSPDPAPSGSDPDANIQTASLTTNAVSPYDSYSVDAAFASSPLPKTVRGVGMELDDGGGWRTMDESLLTRVSPGMSFRSTRQTAGLGFNDGSTMLMSPKAIVTATPNGFYVDQGEVAVTVPANSDQGFRLHFPERDIAVEPGTMLAVNSPLPDHYAEGGAPAPEVKVLDGGMALARGKNGVAPLLANQVYLVDNYTTPDMPGRPLCAAECAALRGTPSPSGLGGGYVPAPAQLVSNTGVAPMTMTPVISGYRKDGAKWIANTYTNQPLTRIRYLSDAYFGLANSRRDLAAALAIGPNSIIDAGDGVFYEIHR